MPATIGNIDLSRGQPPYNPNMGEYLIPANRSFTWESSPQEQGLLASAMGRPDLEKLMYTGQWGPLAGQPHQYQGGRTAIGYGGGGGMGGYPGGYPGGGFPPWQLGDLPPWQTGSWPPVGPTGPTRPDQPIVFTSCFVDGVQVELSDGSEKNVSEISVGDTVKTEKGDGSVVKVFHSKAGKQRLYGFNDKEPFATEAHPFMTQDGWKKISELEIGDTLYRNGLGLDTVKSIDSKEIPEDTPVYNFHVDKQENYYADGYLVHNKTYPTDTKPTTPFDTDPNKWTAPTAGGFVYDPNSVIPEFDQWSMWENQRIRDQNARIQRFQDPTSDINLNFAFEDAKRRGALPTTPLQDKAAFMAMTDANRARQGGMTGPELFDGGNPFADAQRRAAAIQAEQERQRLGFGGGAGPVMGLAGESAAAQRQNMLAQQLAGRQDRMALEARRPFTPIQSPAQEAAAAQRMLQQQAEGARMMAGSRNLQALEAQRTPFTPIQGLAQETAQAERMRQQQAEGARRMQAEQQRRALEAQSRARAVEPVRGLEQESALAQRQQQQQAAQAAEVNRVRALEQQRSQERAGALARQREQESDQRAQQAERNREQRQEASRREQQSQAEARGREQAARQKEANKRAQAQSRAQAASKAAASRAQKAASDRKKAQQAAGAATRAKAASQAAARARNIASEKKRAEREKKTGRASGPSGRK